MPTESVRSQSTARITIAPTVSTTFQDGFDNSQIPRIVVDPPHTEPQRRSFAPTERTNTDGLTEHRAFMTGGVRDWLASSRGRNSSGESVVSVLREFKDQNPRSVSDRDSRNQYSRVISVSSVVDRPRMQRPRSYSRRSTRRSQGSRAGSFRRSSRGNSPATTTTTYVPPPKRKLRLTAFFPFLLSAAAFGCSLALVLAGSRDGMLTDINIVSFNTTNLGTGLLEFSPASSTADANTSIADAAASTALEKRRDDKPSATPTLTTMTTPPAKLDHRSPFDPLDPFGIIPALSSAVLSQVSVDSSALVSVGSAISSALPLPTISIPGLTSSNGTGVAGLLGSGGILSSIGSVIESGLESLLNSVIAGLGVTGITQIIDDKLNTAVTEFIASFLDSAGVQDYYSLYVLSTCSGNSADDITGCSAFSSVANSFSRIGSVIPSSVEIVGTNVSSPALAEMTHAISNLGPMVSGAEKIFLALMILGLINSGLSTLFSFFGIIMPRNRVVLYTNLSLTTLGFITRLLDAILATAVSITLTWATNKFGNTIGASANIGAIFITLVWLGLLFQSLASGFWVVVWFVEFRQVSFRKRRRDTKQVGTYSSILREVASDLSLTKQGKQNDEEARRGEEIREKNSGLVRLGIL